MLDSARCDIAPSKRAVSIAQKQGTQHGDTCSVHENMKTQKILESTQIFGVRPKKLSVRVFTATSTE